MTKYICRNTTYEIDSYESVNRTTNQLLDIATGSLAAQGYDKLSEEEPMTMKHSIINTRLFNKFDNHGDTMIKVGVFWEAVMDSDKHYRLVMKVKIYANANTLNCGDEDECDDLLHTLDKAICKITDDLANMYSMAGISIAYAGTQSFISADAEDTWNHEKNNAMNMYYE